MTDTPSMRERRDQIVAEIDEAAAGRDVQLVAVSKRFDESAILAALEIGCVDLGENYAQELEAKAVSLADAGHEPRWHMIGPVQRNKVKRIAEYVHLWHSIDREAILNEIAKRSPGASVLLQVNLTGEESKSGVAPDQVASMIDYADGLDLTVTGLMTMGPTDTTIDPRPTFARCRELVDSLGLGECSMGMSGDFVAAVEEGSTIVRIGSRIFGQRPA